MENVVIVWSFYSPVSPHNEVPLYRVSMQSKVKHMLPLTIYALACSDLFLINLSTSINKVILTYSNYPIGINIGTYKFLILSAQKVCFV